MEILAITVQSIVELFIVKHATDTGNSAVVS